MVTRRYCKADDCYGRARTVDNCLYEALMRAEVRIVKERSCLSEVNRGSCAAEPGPLSEGITRAAGANEVRFGPVSGHFVISMTGHVVPGPVSCAVRENTAVVWNRPLSRQNRIRYLYKVWRGWSEVTEMFCGPVPSRAKLPAGRQPILGQLLIRRLQRVEMRGRQEPYVGAIVV